MREYVPDNFDRFVIHETEQERHKRLQSRLLREWEEICDSELEDEVLERELENEEGE